MDPVVRLPEAEWQLWSAIWEPYTAKRKTVITPVGAPERYLYFVLEGAQRVFYSDADGHEATLVFTFPGSFGGVLDAMLDKNPSRYTYETLSASTIIRARYTDIEMLAQTNPGISAFIQVSLTAALSGLLHRLAELQSFSSEEKFRALLSRSPQILQHVPHKYLANYLGIDPTNFSKLMNRKVF